MGRLPKYGRAGCAGLQMSVACGSVRGGVPTAACAAVRMAPRVCGWCSAEECIVTTTPRIVIKKYSNRRLYDTAQSCYVTLAQIRKMVVAREDFVVIGHRSEADVTRQVLLQALIDQEIDGKAKMGREALEKLIRAAAAREG